jgi:hypothetical protein
MPKDDAISSIFLSLNYVTSRAQLPVVVPHGSRPKRTSVEADPGARLKGEDSDGFVV